MWSEERGNKTRYFERYEDMITGKKKIASITLEGKDTAKNRKIALESLAEKIKAIHSSQYAPAKKDLTLEELIELYRKDQKLNVSASTYMRNYHAMESMKRILGPDVIVDRLNANYVKTKFQENGDSKNTANERIKRLKAMVKWGFLNDYLENLTWCEKLTKYKDDEQRIKRETKYLELDEIKTLLDSMKITEHRLMTEFMILSGLRIGEAIALEPSDIDFEKRVIVINKTYDYINGIVVDPKTPSSNREVYMQDELLDLVKKIIDFENNKMSKMAAGQPKYLFCTMNNEHYEYAAYNKYLKEKSEKALGRPLTTHALRHTHVAIMAPYASIEAISRRLGHEDSHITKSVYFHVTEKLKEKDNAQFEKIKIL